MKNAKYIWLWFTPLNNVSILWKDDLHRQAVPGVGAAHRTRPASPPPASHPPLRAGAGGAGAGAGLLAPVLHSLLPSQAGPLRPSRSHLLLPPRSRGGPRPAW